MRSIRNGYPKAEICLLTSTEAAPVAKNYNFLDKVWEFPIRELRRNKTFLLNIIFTIYKLRKSEFDVVINLYRVCSYTGALKMGLLFLAIKADEKIGHANKHFGLFLSKKVPSITFAERHVADAMLEIALLAGGKPDNNPLEVCWQSASQERWSNLFIDEAVKNRELKIGINPGGDRQNRRWEPANFAGVAKQLMATTNNFRFFILGGPGEEQIARIIEEKITDGCVNLSGKLTLNDLIFVISKLDLLITNDSGPMHIGAALGIPIVAIFGPENPALFHPYTEKDKYIVVRSQLAYPDDTNQEKIGSSQLDKISPNEVLEAVKKLIDI